MAESREPSEWPWSIADEVAFATRKISGSTTGSAPALDLYKTISRCSAVGSAPALGAGTPKRFDFPKCWILPYNFGITPDYFR